MSTQETAKTLYLEANNIKFAYRLIGITRDGKLPLLLLNHFRSNIDLWDPILVNALSASRQVITYDYAGIGHSGGEVETTIKGFSANVIAFLKALLPTLNVDSVDALGFSIGGYVVQQLALDSPKLVKRLVLSGTGPSGSIGHSVYKPTTDVQTAIMNPNPDGAAILDAFFSSMNGSKEAGNAWINRSVASRQALAGKNGEPEFTFFLTGPGLPRLVEAYLKWDADPMPYALLHTIQKDALVTAGSNDLIMPTQNSYQLSRQLPRAHFVVYPGSGHGHLFQFPEFYAKQVTSFLDGEWPTPPLTSGSLPEIEQETVRNSGVGFEE